MLNELIVKVGADIKDFLSKMKTLESNLQDVSDSFQAIGENMTTFVTLPMVAAGAASVKLASDMGETLNKVNVAFGDSAKEVLNWSETSVEQMGLAAGTALDAAALFGDMGTSMGFAKDDAAGMAMSLTQLGADLASFKNIPIEQAMQALNGVFTGETESLKMLGVVMTQTQLQAFALTQGITKKVEKMTEAEAVALRYAFVMDRTKNAQGDFARTSEGSANQMRMFMESLKELGVQFGNIILPTFTEFITKINEVLKGMMDLSPEVKKAIIVFGAIAAVVGPLLLVLSAMIPVIINLTTAAGAMISALQFLTAASTWTAAINGLNAALASLRVTMLAVAANPITALVAAFAAVVYAGVQMYENWDKISNKLKFLAVTVGGVAGQLATLGAFLAKNWDGVQLAFEMIVEKIKNNFRYLLFRVNPIIAMLVNVGIELAKKWDVIAGAVGYAFEKAKKFIENASKSINSFIESIKKYAQENFGSVIKIVEAVGGVFSDVFNWIRQNVPFVNEAIDSMKQTFSDFSTELERRRQVKVLEELHEQTQKNVWISDYMNKKNIETTRTTYDANTAMQGLLASINSQTTALKDNGKASDEAKKKAKELADAQEQLKNSSLKWTNELGNAIMTALRNRQKATDEEIKDLERRKTESQKFHEEQLSDIKKSYDSQVKLAEDANEKIVDSINRRYDKEQELLMSNLDKQVKPYENRIKMIDDVMAREQEAIAEQEFEAKRNEIAKKKSLSSLAEHHAKVTDELSTYLIEQDQKLLEKGKSLRYDNLIELTDEENSLVRKRLNDARQLEKKSLEMQIAGLKQNAAMQAVIDEARRTSELSKQEDAFEEEKARINNIHKLREEIREKDYASVIKFYDDEIKELQKNYVDYSNEVKAQDEAKKLLMTNNHSALMELLKSWNPDWKERGRDFGEMLLSGIQSKIPDLNKAISELMSKVGAVYTASNAALNSANPALSGVTNVFGMVPPKASNTLGGNQTVNLYTNDRLIASSAGAGMNDILRSKVNTNR